MTETAFTWLIEAPGANYLGTREIGHYPEFFWTGDHSRALRFMCREHADGVMMAVRRMEPALFAFAVNLGDAWPREHGWLADGPKGHGTAEPSNGPTNNAPPPLLRGEG